MRFLPKNLKFIISSKHFMQNLFYFIILEFFLVMKKQCILSDINCNYFRVAVYLKLNMDMLFLFSLITVLLDKIENNS